VGVPKCAGAGGEADVVAHAVVGGEDGIHVDCPAECFGWLAGVGFGLVGALDELHFGLVIRG
jgi:hypothetical protein